VATIDFLQGQKSCSWSAGTESICAPRLTARRGTAPSNSQYLEYSKSK
jgi:hypothetical protein